MYPFFTTFLTLGKACVKVNDVTKILWKSLIVHNIHNTSILKLKKLNGIQP